jgi:hypothetical protein
MSQSRIIRVNMPVSDHPPKTTSVRSELTGVSGEAKMPVQIRHLSSPNWPPAPLLRRSCPANFESLAGFPQRSPGSKGSPRRTLGSCERPAAAECTGSLIRGLSVSVAGVRSLPSCSPMLATRYAHNPRLPSHLRSPERSCPRLVLLFRCRSFGILSVESFQSRTEDLHPITITSVPGVHNPMHLSPRRCVPNFRHISCGG